MHVLMHICVYTLNKDEEWDKGRRSIYIYIYINK